MSARRIVFRSLVLRACALFLFVGPLCCGSAFAQADEDPAHCDGVTAGGQIRFQGRTLLETPDIRAPELRLANVLVSSRCWNRADSVLAAYAQAKPGDHRIFFVYARIAWIWGNRPRAEAMARSQVQSHPDFTSMKVLLASMAVEDGQFAVAGRLLDEIQAKQPADLWAYIDRLRIEAALTPTPKLGETLRAIATDARFPPSARAQAADTVRFVPDPTNRRDDEIFDAQMADPVLANDCRLALKAQEQLDVRGDADGTVALLERYIGRNMKCFGTPRVRTILAQAYLTQAAAVAPTPTEATTPLYDKARAVLQDDFTPLALWLAVRPAATSRLRGYLGRYVDFAADDGTDASILCTAISALNATMVTLALDHGAAVDQSCDGRTVVDSVLLMATTGRAPERQAVLRALLEHGASSEGAIAFCSSPANGDCRAVLLPILQKYPGGKPITKT